MSSKREEKKRWLYETISNDCRGLFNAKKVFEEDLKTDSDFLQYDKTWHGDIITNPPYKFAKEFIEKSLEILRDGNKCAMFLKIQFLEGKARKKLFTKYPPKKIYVSSSRLLCAKNADFDGMKAGGGSAVAYAWFIWEKGFQGQTTIEWFN